MQYKPNFCCECGGKIDRAEPDYWTSGRFCDVCVESRKFVEWKSTGVLIGGLVFLVIGFGFYLNSSSSPELTGAKNLSTRNIRSASNHQSAENVNFNSAALPNKPVTSVGIENSPPVAAKTEKSASPTIISDTEKVYFCGARTKKGTPCSRRVKGGGRCWQHQGMPAMLPEKDLAINQ